MAQISRHALMPFSAQQMYDIVNAVDRYQEFLPWCARSEILHQDNHSMKARILMKKGKLNHSFSTLNELADGQRIGINLVDGPFKRLQGEWIFTALGEQQSKIELKLEFEFSNRVVALLIGPLFTQIANTLVDAFSQRARQIYRAKT